MPDGEVWPRRTPPDREARGALPDLAGLGFWPDAPTPCPHHSFAVVAGDVPRAGGVAPWRAGVAERRGLRSVTIQPSSSAALDSVKVAMTSRRKRKGPMSNPPRIATRSGGWGRQNRCGSPIWVRRAPKRLGLWILSRTERLVPSRVLSCRVSLSAKRRQTAAHPRRARGAARFRPRAPSAR